jgi:hypothetical protein
MTIRLEISKPPTSKVRGECRVRRVHHGSKDITQNLTLPYPEAYHAPIRWQFFSPRWQVTGLGRYKGEVYLGFTNPIQTQLNSSCAMIVRLTTFLHDFTKLLIRIDMNYITKALP